MEPNFWSKTTRVTIQGTTLASPILGGSPRRLGSLVGQDGAWSPDGSILVYADGRDLFLAKSDGTESRKLVSLDRPRFLSGMVTRRKQTEVYAYRLQDQSEFALGSFGAGSESAPVVSRMAQSSRRMLREMDGGWKILRFPIAGADLGPLRKGRVSSPILGQTHPVDFQPARFVHSPSQQGWQEAFRGRPDLPR